MTPKWIFCKYKFVLILSMDCLQKEKSMYNPPKQELEKNQLEFKPGG